MVILSHGVLMLTYFTALTVNKVQYSIRTYKGNYVVPSVTREMSMMTRKQQQWQWLWPATCTIQECYTEKFCFLLYIYIYVHVLTKLCYQGNAVAH